MSSQLLEFLKHKIYLSGCCTDDSCFRKITVTCSFYLFIYLAVQAQLAACRVYSLHCSIWIFSGNMWDLALTTNQTQSPCPGSVESQPPDQWGSPSCFFLEICDDDWQRISSSSICPNQLFMLKKQCTHDKTQMTKTG